MHLLAYGFSTSEEDVYDSPQFLNQNVGKSRSRSQESLNLSLHLTNSIGNLLQMGSNR